MKMSDALKMQKLDRNSCPQIRPYLGENIIRHYGYYDGPLSGLLRWNGGIFYFATVEEEWEPAGWLECFHDDLTAPEQHCERNRYFAVVALSPSQLRKRLKADTLFQKYVGKHCNYDEFGKRQLGLLKSSKSREFYYSVISPLLPSIDIDDNEIVAWFKNIS